MNDNIWPWVLSAVGLAGLWFAGKKRAVGWYISLGAQLLWIAFALITGQLGFLLSAAGYGVMYARNAWRWTRGPGAVPAPQAPIYSSALLYEQHTAPIFARFHDDLAAWQQQLVAEVRRTQDDVTRIILDHRLAYDPARCLGCTWIPEDVAPAYSVVDQHQAHVEREIHRSFADRVARKEPIRLCMR